MDHVELQAQVASRPFWYHAIELPGGIITPGGHPISRAAYRIPPDLSGLRVLDIGAWDGYWSFEALRRGGREVLAIDDFSDLLGTLTPAHRRGWENFDLCRAALGLSEERCRREELSVYELDSSSHGEFDAVFFFGTIYHLRHPLLALERIRSVCRGSLYVESAIADDYSAFGKGLGDGYGTRSVCEFFAGNEYGGNPSNWWVPTLSALSAMIESSGFQVRDAWKLSERPNALSMCRGFVRAEAC